MTDHTYLIVGLGNPGKQYERTRHNVGFMALEHLSKRWNIEGKSQIKFHAIVGKGKVRIDGTPFSVVLAEPTTFMNLSGKAVKAISHFYQIEPDNILVIFDDIAIPIGKVRLRLKGGAGGHNGIKSIIADLGTDTFCRFRIGVGGPQHSGDLKNHVLSHFLPEEQAIIEKLMPLTEDVTSHWLTQGIESAMNQFNNTLITLD